MEAFGFEQPVAANLYDSLTPGQSGSLPTPGGQLKSLFVKSLTTITAATTLGAGATLGSGTVRACRLQLVSGTTYEPVEVTPNIDFDVSSERLSAIAAGQYFSVDREDFSNRWHVC